MSVESNPKKTLWMGDLQPSMDEAFIISNLQMFGVRVCKVKINPSKGPPSYAIIEFEDEDVVDWAVCKLNKRPIPLCPLKKFVLAVTYDGKDLTGLNEFPLMVHKITKAVDYHSLTEFFQEKYSSVSEAIVVLGHKRTTGIVFFASEIERNKALTEMNGVKGIKTDNPLFVSLPQDPQACSTLRRKRSYSTYHTAFGASRQDLSEWPIYSPQMARSTVAMCESEEDSDEEEVDPNDPVKCEELNTDYFTQDRILFHSLENQMWYPVLHLNSRLYSKKIKDALYVSHVQH